MPHSTGALVKPPSKFLLHIVAHNLCTSPFCRGLHKTLCNTFNRDLHTTPLQAQSSRSCVKLLLLRGVCAQPHARLFSDRFACNPLEVVHNPHATFFVRVGKFSFKFLEPLILLFHMQLTTFLSINILVCLEFPVLSHNP